MKRERKEDRKWKNTRKMEDGGDEDDDGDLNDVIVRKATRGIWRGR
jgi:hypothetical protein